MNILTADRDKIDRNAFKNKLETFLQLVPESTKILVYLASLSFLSLLPFFS